MTGERDGERRVRQRRQLRLLAGLAVAMFAFGFAMVPLYGLFCEVTGAQRGGLAAVATRGAGEAGRSGGVQDRSLVVKFDGTVHPDLPWDFQPLQRKLEVHPGETYEMRFVATNRSNRRVTGQAIPAVAPWQATAYFHKLECFCFSRQTLEGNERVEMPVRFTVSPDLPEGIDSLTLSYSFLRMPDGRESG